MQARPESIARFNVSLGVRFPHGVPYRLKEQEMPNHDLRSRPICRSIMYLKPNRNRQLSLYFGGCNSLFSQPKAFVFIGSDAITFCSL
jgi:hypothetical protein